MKDLKTLVKEWKFGFVSDDMQKCIDRNMFPAPASLRTGYKEFRFAPDRYMAHYEVVEEMKKEGYEPANIYELLNWHDWDGSDWVIALASPVIIHENTDHEFVPYVGKDFVLVNLDLVLLYTDFHPTCRYLGVRP